MRTIAINLLFAIMTAGLSTLAIGSVYGQTTTPAPAVTPPSDVAVKNGETIPAHFNQPPTSPTTDKEPRPKEELQQAGTVTINGVRYYLTTKTPYEFNLAIITVIVGLITMGFVCFLFYGHIADKTDDFVKLFAFVVVVFSAVFLITVGYSDTQTAPVYSLLGTIIGYIFGRDISMRQRASEPGIVHPPPHAAPPPAQNAPPAAPGAPAS